MVSALYIVASLSLAFVNFVKFNYGIVLFIIIKDFYHIILVKNKKGEWNYE
ncbi:MAG: hypothetical protein PHG41_05515 [Actinomycetota bacterium]|nr:hypothetical protein [Actinomycetota bacterium]